MDDFEDTRQNEDLKDDEEKEGTSKSSLIVFILLFALVTGLLVYYQFYQGHGQWRFTLLHKSNDTTLLQSIKKTYPDTARMRVDSSKMAHVDSSKKDTMAHISTPVDTPASTASTNAEPKKLKPVKVDEEPPTGTVYEVQIGTFENYTLKHYNAVFNNLHEEKAGKLTKLTLGRFSTMPEADAFKKDMIKLGVKHAWVVKKVNGKRVG